MIEGILLNSGLLEALGTWGIDGKHAPPNSPAMVPRPADKADDELSLSC